MKNSKIALYAAIFIAMAFTVSCSSGGGGGGINSCISSDCSSSSGGYDSSSGSYDNGCSIQGYETVQIGAQTWMAENFNCEVEGSKCYDNNPDNCAKYGRLYDWAMAMNLDPSCNSTLCANQIQLNYQGICPPGWHIPSDAEWEMLGSATPLKTIEGWNDGYGYIAGTNTSGFSALPGGNYSNGSFRSEGYSGLWWSSTEYRVGDAYRRIIYHDANFVGSNYMGKVSMLSVRCLKDD